MLRGIRTITPENMEKGDVVRSSVGIAKTTLFSQDLLFP